MSQMFFYDEFFADDSVTEPITLTLKGREVTIHVKKVVALGDREAAKQAVMIREMDADGKVVVKGFDLNRFGLEMLARMIVRWPFVYRPKPGSKRDPKPVPVSYETVSRFIGDGAEELMMRVTKIISGPSEEDLAPFDQPSGAGSQAKAPEGN
jgi:hypothetical protein